MHGICAGFKDSADLSSQTAGKTLSKGEVASFTGRVCSSRRCPSCVFSSNSLIESRATLIVTPASILHQWEREIRRHTSLAKGREPLKVVVYPGIRAVFRVKHDNANQRHLVHPSILADNDIVLITFATLRDDLGHSEDNPYLDGTVKNLRSRKKYRVVPSPLTGIKWWRVCLDEAQKIETPTVDSSKMAVKLTSVYRWCVSGTPVGKGKVDDLYGLLLFLRLRPFWGKRWFDACFSPKIEGVVDRVQMLLTDVFWRSTKSNENVKRQMGVPDQVERKVLLSFSSIERHFYERQLQSTVEAATAVVGKLSRERKRQRNGKVEALALQLHRLRAACCHPQVGASGITKTNKKRRTVNGQSADEGGIIVGNGVLSMDQILDRLIDDAKSECEDAQRIVVMHANAMAALSKLKIEVDRVKGIETPGKKYLLESSTTYLDTLDEMEKCAKSVPVAGETIVTGSVGLRVQRQMFRHGKVALSWKVQRDDEDIKQDRSGIWASFEFEGPAKKLNQIQVCPQSSNDPSRECLMPKDCVLQVSHSALGGAFLDVIHFSLPNKSGQKTTTAAFPTNVSKTWRLLVKNYHANGAVLTSALSHEVCIEVELREADIAFDSLQRLHTLHNGAMTLESLQLSRSDVVVNRSGHNLSSSQIKHKVEKMYQEAKTIESRYMEEVRSPHERSKLEFETSLVPMKDLLKKLAKESLQGRKAMHDASDFWCDAWWEDVLLAIGKHGTEQEHGLLCDRVRTDVEELCDSAWNSTAKNMLNYKLRPLPPFNDLNGLHLAISSRLIEIDKTYSQVTKKFSALSDHPREDEINENSHCGTCRKDWNQTGPTCRHCKLEQEIRRLDVDRVLELAIKTIWKWLKERQFSKKVDSVRKSMNIDRRATAFFDCLAATQKQLKAAKVLWIQHQKLLGSIDELNQCKQSMRLIQPLERLRDFTDEERNAVVLPDEVGLRYMDHKARREMALGQLRRTTHTLRFLRNQSHQANLEHCSVCLSSLEGELAFLRCGHRFHFSCVEDLMGRSPGSDRVACPFKCPLRTEKAEIMISTDKRKDDGSQSKRAVRGSWGTKVTRLVSDLMDAIDTGEKSLVFSQWEDMLVVVEAALKVNSINYVRLKGMSKIAQTMQRFRSNDCSVLLMNVKNGAEGLTLVEATHVFMIEPLLNCGLDSQAISRLNRIGQTCKTFVHRYLIKDTVEIKIDRLREEMQGETEVEDALQETRKGNCGVNGGGIDGGFSEDQLHELLK